MIFSGMYYTKSLMTIVVGFAIYIYIHIYIHIYLYKCIDIDI